MVWGVTISRVFFQPCRLMLLLTTCSSQQTWTSLMSGRHANLPGLTQQFWWARDASAKQLPVQPLPGHAPSRSCKDASSTCDVLSCNMPLLVWLMLCVGSYRVALPCRFRVSVSGGPGSSAGLGVSRRGVYMRQPHEAAGPANYTVTITPTLHEVGPAFGIRLVLRHCVHA